MDAAFAIGEEAAILGFSAFDSSLTVSFSAVFLAVVFFAVFLAVVVFFAVAFFIGKKDKLLILASGLYGVNMFIQYIPNITNPISIFSLVAVLLLVGLISVNCIPALKDKVHFTKKYFWLPTLMFFIIEIII